MSDQSSSRYKTVYLPPIHDPQKLRRGIIEIINLVKAQETKGKNQEQTEDLYSAS